MPIKGQEIQTHPQSRDAEAESIAVVHTPSGLPTDAEAMRYLNGTFSWDAFPGRNAIEGALACTFGITIEESEALTRWLIAAGYLLRIAYDPHTGHVSRVLRGRTQVYTQAVDRGRWVTAQGRIRCDPLELPDSEMPRTGMYLTAAAAERHFA